MLDGEEKLIALAVKGEPQAFGALYDHYQPQIYRFIYLKVGGREEAEDLSHQTFLNAWLGIGKYKHRGFPFSSWLYQIARNQIVDHYRSRHESSSLEDIDPESVVVENFQNETVEQALEIERVTAAIRRLKPEYQDVLIMRFVEDLSVRDVSAALDKSEGAIKLLQHRAIKLLREELGENISEKNSLDDTAIT